MMFYANSDRGNEEDCLIAHIRLIDNEYQSLLDHLWEVSELTGEFAEKIQLKEAGKIIGLLHDLGKASQEFQSYLLSATGVLDPDGDDYVDAKSMKGRVDHSTAGAQIIYEILKDGGQEEKFVAQVLALCLASHHSGLIDCLTPDGENNFDRRIDKAEIRTHKAEALDKVSRLKEKLNDSLIKNAVSGFIQKAKNLREANDSKETLSFKRGLLIRILFSCLIDADRINTADFEFPKNARIRAFGRYHSWNTLIERLNVKLSEFRNKDGQNEVGMLRNQVSEECFKFSEKPKGIYQLTVPTGGGKTLASLRFGLNHARIHSMDRIFYIVPYTSIIDQNAEEVRKILDDRDENNQLLDNVVLEHHSNLTPEEETNRQNLLAQNWDAQVVFTTQVQFLEALFGSGTRGVRRMHQLANSVIILDEVQTLPINTIHMVNVALRFLVHACGATVVLSTATQPPLDKIDASYRGLTIHSEQRMIANEIELFEKLRRVKVFDKRITGGWDEQAVARLVGTALKKKGSILAVVNTRRSARLLYEACACNDGAFIYHLSTNMCPSHRLTTLNAVRKKLEKKEPVICISTQLIEAGVDIDFGSVIRYLAGMDSVAQAAGRCNRHGQQQDRNGNPELGHVYIVNPKYERADRIVDIKIGIDESTRFMDEFACDPTRFQNNLIGLEAMATFYQYYFYKRKDEMNYNVDASSPVGRNDNLFNLLSTNSNSIAAYARIHNSSFPPLYFFQSFQTAARAFRVIDSKTQGVIVPYSDGKNIINDLCSAFKLEQQYDLLRRAQRFSVNLFSTDFKRLVDMNAIREVQTGTGVFYLDDQFYSEQFGWSDEIVNDMKFNCY